MIAGSLGLLLLWAAVHKAWAPADAHRLIEAALGADAPAGIIWAAIAIEWAIGMFLLSLRRTRLAMALFLTLLTLLSVTLFAALSRGFEGSCGCLGMSESASGALLRNAALAGLALVAFFIPVAGSGARGTLAEGAHG